VTKLEFAAHTPSKENPEVWHSLREHLEKVATRCQKSAEKLGADKLGYYGGLWHDLGKYNPGFQEYLKDCHRGAQAESVQHAIHGAILAARSLQPIAAIIHGHHAGLPEIQEMMQKRIHDPAWQDSYQVVITNAQQAGIELAPDFDWQALMAKLKLDALGYELFLRLLFSCLVDADYLDTESHFEPKTTQQRSPVVDVSQLWNLLEADQAKLLDKAAATRTMASKASSVNQVRAEVYQACIAAAQLEPGVFRLAVPTGGGKTRSGLAFALKHAVANHLDRVIIAVPYTSIIEQTVGVYRSIFGDEAVLEHHSAAKAVVDNEDARAAQAKARLATQNWDAPLIVTTTVQLFESLFARKPSRCRKLHNIVNSVIVLDEVQTLPIGLIQPIVNLLEELAKRYRVTVVLCTATQPALEGGSSYLEGFSCVQDIVPVELAKSHFRSLSRVSYEMPKGVWSWAQVRADIEKHQHNQALIILNARKDALDLLAEFSGLDESLPVFHLSTLLCGKHRRAVLADVRSRLAQDQPCILISTQVVEAGVDLDFPAVYRALGPLDRIVQAAGRCNREGKRETKGRVVIFQPEAGRMPPGEYATAFAETANLLKRKLDMDDPEIFLPYFQSLYQGINTDKHEIQQSRVRLNYPETAERFELIPKDTQPVIIEYDEQAKTLLRQIQQRGLLKRNHQDLQPYIVNLRDREFRAAKDVRREIAPGIWVWEGSYDPGKGICLGEAAIVQDPADLIF
jgi:CRISPR-associated endonuclease/helicase Cas3